MKLFIARIVLALIEKVAYPIFDRVGGLIAKLDFWALRKTGEDHE